MIPGTFCMSTSRAGTRALPRDFNIPALEEVLGISLTPVPAPEPELVPGEEDKGEVQVLRALLDELQADPDLAARVRTRIGEARR